MDTEKKKESLSNLESKLELDEFNEPVHDHHVHGPNCNHHHHGIAPIVRNEPKIGRNDPCTCGSGKKFKKCCGS